MIEGTEYCDAGWYDIAVRKRSDMLKLCRTERDWDFEFLLCPTATLFV